MSSLLSQVRREINKQVVLRLLETGERLSLFHPERVGMRARTLTSIGNELVREKKARWAGPFLQSQGQ